MPPKKTSKASEAPQESRSETPEVLDSEDRVPVPVDNNPVNVNQDDEASVDDRKSPLADETTATLTQAILLMTKELRRRENTSSKAKAKEPDTFDGSDPKKLNNYILLCNLFFRSNSAYDDDSTKVNFALSYLRGTALEYFEPSILDADEVPDWMDNWSAFVRTLRVQFGPIDPTADAEDSIDNLKMQDNQHIVKYNVEFNRLAIRTRWDDSVLRHRYYHGLAERIKDIMGQIGKPPLLEDMKILAHSIDSRHWERLREKSRSNKGKSDDKPDHKKSDDKSKTPSSTSGNNQSGNNKNSNSGNKSSNKSGKTPSTSGSSATLPEKLGKDGKLTPQERQRRFDNNLCLFCGGTGHSARDCPKSTSSASKAKARSVQAKEKETPEAKKG
jgi:Retrotransposon gag protein/Zinc knuckle